ncbi:MAG: DNA integrity scanning protein DisA nucleotide-binding domain protein, partial [Deltaproteobacteria bacterium]|nr:DNA integrity scanning protein DisA nucleotide-binding domain protein [Deltaproteobacteria bacterium]
MAFKEICGLKEYCKHEVLEHTIELAVEIAREGREGRKIGTLFIVSDENETLKRSKNLILDPLYGHPKEAKKICDPNVRETIKELAQLDGAFIV